MQALASGRLEIHPFGFLTAPQRWLQSCAYHGRSAIDPPAAFVETTGGSIELNALDVVREIIERHKLLEATFTLLVHPTAPGWRERHRTIDQRIDHSFDDVVEGERTRRSLSGHELARCSLDDLNRYRDDSGHVLSICSRLHTPNGTRHLALMDLHPDGFIPHNRMTAAVQPICRGRSFWLLRTDRHHHVYGDFTMSEDEWLCWNAGFQLPATLVDAHYVGRSLQLGYNALRLNAGTEYQRAIPATVDGDPDVMRDPIVERAVRLARNRQSTQLRKSGEPTINHLHEVAELAVAIYGALFPRDLTASCLYACGYLHDSIEDSATDFDDIEGTVGRQVAEWVSLLSEDKRLPAQQRREAYECQIAAAPRAVQIVKLADLLSNLRGIRGSEPSTWIRGYLDVSERQLALLSRVPHSTKWFNEARHHIQHWRQWLQEVGRRDQVAALTAEARDSAS